MSQTHPGLPLLPFASACRRGGGGSGFLEWGGLRGGSLLAIEPGLEQARPAPRALLRMDGSAEGGQDLVCCHAGQAAGGWCQHQHQPHLKQRVHMSILRGAKQVCLHCGMFALWHV